MEGPARASDAGRDGSEARGAVASSGRLRRELRSSLLSFVIELSSSCDLFGVPPRTACGYTYRGWARNSGATHKTQERIRYRFRSAHARDALPGALPLPHGARLHPSRVCARSAGARSTHDSVPPAVRLRRQRGQAAAVLVPPVGRTGGYCCCGLLLGAQPSCVHTYSTLARPLRLSVCP